MSKLPAVEPEATRKTEASPENSLAMPDDRHSQLGPIPVIALCPIRMTRPRTHPPREPSDGQRTRRPTASSPASA